MSSSCGFGAACTEISKLAEIKPLKLTTFIFGVLAEKSSVQNT